MVKTAIIIGGYSRSGKSTAMRHLGQSIPTVSMSQELTKHVKLLIPYLAQYDFASAEVKALSFPVSTAAITNTRFLKALDTLGFSTDFWDVVKISRDYYHRLRDKVFVTVRDICIAVAESTRLIYPNIYVDLALNNLVGSDLVAIESIGGKECDYLYKQLKAKEFVVVGQNIRRETELAGIDIRELIRDNQCDYLNDPIYNNYSETYFYARLRSVVLFIRDKQGSGCR